MRKSQFIVVLLARAALADDAKTTLLGDKTSMTVTFDPSPNRGEKVYKTYCHHCHGERGDGTGHIGRGLEIKPMDLTAPEFATRMTARNIAFVVREGSGKPNAAMIPWKTVLPDELIEDVSTYTERLAAEGRARRGDGGAALTPKPTPKDAVAATPPRPQPRLVENKPVTGMASLANGVSVVLAYDDGAWRDPTTQLVARADALLSDPVAKPIASPQGWLQPIKASYRGKEGWQKLRWGMTTAEVSTALGKVERLKPSDGLQLAWRWKIGDTPVVAEAILVDGRLAGVMVRVPNNTFDTVRDLVVAKYGEPTEHGAQEARWSTPESSISVKVLALTPSVLYMSRAFAVQGTEQLALFQKRQADEGL